MEPSAITQDEKLGERYRALFEASTDAVVVGEPLGRILEVNPAACRLFGYPAEELIGRQGSELTAPEWLAIGQQAAVRKVRGIEELSVYETVIVDRLGTRIPVEVKSTPIRHEGEVIAIHAIMRDLTARKRSEAALRESEERFRLAFESAPIGMALIDLPEGRALRVNDALCAFLGYDDSADLIGTTFRDRTHPDDFGADIEHSEAMMRGEIQAYSLEKRFVRKDETVVWGQISASLVRGANGEPIYGIAQFQDITDRKRVELLGAQARRRHAAAGPLTRREREVLGLFAQGLTSAETAERLGVGTETVQTHVRRALRKLGARSRTHAVAVALREGLLDDQSPTETPSLTTL
jgi:two-component system sensor histidine kinase UhpB